MTDTLGGSSHSYMVRHPRKSAYKQYTAFSGENQYVFSKKERYIFMEKMKDIAKQPPIEWGGQIVITTAQLAQAYGATKDNISDNFTRNKDRFTAGKHFILLEGEALKEFKNYSAESGLVSKNARQLYLWTRRGASRHCKILGTDKAWEQFDYLEDNYFDREKQQTPPQTLQSQIRTIAQGTDELYQRVDTLEERFTKFEDELPVSGADMDDIQSAVKKKGVQVMGGKESNAYRDKSTRTYVYADIQCELRRQFGVKRYKEIKHKDAPDAVRIIENYQLPIVLKNRVDMANAQQTLPLEGGAQS